MDYSSWRSPVSARILTGWSSAMSDYDTDFYQWTQMQAAALRAKDIAALDLDNLGAEIGTQ
jgi:hypothetical protein